MSLNGNNKQFSELKKQFEVDPPKIIGGYKRQVWAQKVLDKIENDDIEKEPKGLISAKAILEAKNGTFYPAFLLLDTKKSGKIQDAFFITEDKEQFNLIPLELALQYSGKEDGDLMPFRYRTLSKIKGDLFQKNWPDFS